MIFKAISWILGILAILIGLAFALGAIILPWLALSAASCLLFALAILPPVRRRLSFLHSRPILGLVLASAIVASFGGMILGDRHKRAEVVSEAQMKQTFEQIDRDATNAAVRAGLQAWLDKDFNKARTLLEGPAAAGEPRAMTTLAIMYLGGSGFPKDEARGVQLLRGAADKGDSDAQFYLGRMYNNKRGQFGIANDYEKSVHYLALAAAQGHPEAKYYLGLDYELGRGIAKDAIKAARLCEEAAVANVPGAQYHLALLYHDGMGVEQDQAKAAEWIAKAKANGYDGES